jgi:hypothetical protein
MGSPASRRIRTEKGRDRTEKGNYIGLGGVGAYVRELLDTPREIDDVCSRLQKEFAVAPDVCRREVETFFDDLMKHGARSHAIHHRRRIWDGRLTELAGEASTGCRLEPDVAKQRRNSSRNELQADPGFDGCFVDGHPVSSESVMTELTERAWKHRFAERLSLFFVSRGVAPEDALEDAYAHADAEYAARESGTPVQYADANIAAIEAETEGRIGSPIVRPSLPSTRDDDY